jgi:subtilase family serine protease
MTYSKTALCAAAPSLLTLAAISASSAFAQLQNNVSAATHLASDLGLADPSQVINLTVHLKPQNEAAFEKTVDALYDPASPTYHHWLTDDDLKKFAPPQAQLQAVQKELESRGLTLISSDENGFSLRVRGTTANAEHAFNTSIHQFQHNGKTFRANVQNAQLNGARRRQLEIKGGRIRQDGSWRPPTSVLLFVREAPSLSSNSGETLCISLFLPSEL